MRHIDPAARNVARMRSAFGRFATGVTVITFDAADGRHGMTANSFSSVSVDPPLVVVNVDRKSHAHDALAGTPFAINVLGAEQNDLALHFAGRPNLEPPWVEGEVAPRLARTLAYFECTPWAAYDGGDHTMYLGRVADFDYRDGDALGFSNSRFTVIPETSLGQEFLI